MVLLTALAGATAWCSYAVLPGPCYAENSDSIPALDSAFAGETKTSSAGVMRIYAIDVGQGDSALVLFPDGSNMLIDCGPSSSEKNIESLLTRLSISRLNQVVVTHTDSDHDGGYSRLQSHGYIDSSTQRYDWNNTDASEVLFNNAGVTVTCVTTNGHIIGGAYVNPGSTTNDTCVGVLIRFRGFDYLSCGDLEATLENLLGDALAARGDKVDILKVDHHGSRYSSPFHFLQQIMPEFAVIMVGDGNSYGHPTQETLDRLNDSSVHVQRIFQTEAGAGGTAGNVTVANGQVMITTDGATYTFQNEGPGSNSFYYGPYSVDEYVTPTMPHLIISEAAIASSYLSPENHRWIELSLPPGASPIDLSKLYWISKGLTERLAKNGSLSMEPGDVAIVHKTSATDLRADESDATSMGSNGWWDVYTHLDGTYWVTTDDCFMISRENSLAPNALNILDSVIWSNHDSTVPSNTINPLNYLISNYQWGNPIAGSGFFSASNDASGVGSIDSGYAQRTTTEDTDSMQDWVMSAVNSEGTPPPTPTPLPTNTPEPPPPKQIAVVLNKDVFSAGDILTVDVVAQPITGRPFDAYAAIMRSDGGVLFWIRAGNSLSSGQTPLPLATKVGSLPNGYSGRLLSVTVPPGSEGNYRIGAGLVDAGTSVKKAINPFTYDIAGLSVR